MFRINWGVYDSTYDGITNLPICEAWYKKIYKQSVNFLLFKKNISISKMYGCIDKQENSPFPKPILPDLSKNAYRYSSHSSVLLQMCVFFSRFTILNFTAFQLNKGHHTCMKSFDWKFILGELLCQYTLLASLMKILWKLVKYESGHFTGYSPSKCHGWKHNTRKFSPIYTYSC